MYIILACLFLGLGALGAVMPILPTTPFLLLASYFFAKGSSWFHKWFIGTSLYKNHLEEFITSKAMTLEKKLYILIPVSIVLIITAVLVKNIYSRIGILCVIALKHYYFFAHIDTTSQCHDKMSSK